MTECGSHTYHEILSQPVAWEGALRAVKAMQRELLTVWRSQPVERLLFTGCGSTYYLSLAAAALAQELTGLPASALPASEIWLYPENSLSQKKTMLVAVSRSGATTETLRAVETFRSTLQDCVISITNYGDSPLAGMADAALIIPEGQEESVAQTRSFASMYVAINALLSLLAGQDKLLEAIKALPGLGERLLQKYGHLARFWGENLSFDRFYFLGSGPRYGLACEANLKMKEMTLTHSEPFHFLEFRHGPMSMVTGSTAIAGLLSEANHRHEGAVLAEMKQRGGHTLSLGEIGTDVLFESGLPDEIYNVLYLPVLQLMAYYRSMAKGLDPDRPNNLTAVVHLDI